MGESATSFSPPNLLCQEDGAFLNVDGDEPDTYIDLGPCLVSEDEEDVCTENLVHSESAYFGSQGFVASSFHASASRSQSWLKSARLYAIYWIFKLREKYDLQFCTAYLSVTYFDRFLSMQRIDNEELLAIRALAIACLFLATKMVELKGLACLSSRFEVEVCHMENELIVLEALEWDMNLVTPFTYLHYFFKKFCGESRPKEPISRAVRHILNVIPEINLVDHRPSVIAAAAVLVAIDGQLTREALELKTSVISLRGSLENEHIFSCYNLLQNIEKGEAVTHFSVYNSSSADCLIGVIHNSSSAIAARIKERLPFINADHNCIVKSSLN